MLFYHIKQCQEIRQIGKVPYSNNHIIATAVLILVTFNMFQLKESNVWKSMPNKMYPALKMFFHKAYGQCLTALEIRSTSVQNRSTSQTIYNDLEGDDNTDDNTVMTITQTAAVTGAGTMATAAGMSEITSNAYSLTSTSFWQTKPSS